jgi:serine/threonine-protein kinase haspin
VVDAAPVIERSTTDSKLISIFDDLPPAPVWTSVVSKMKKREVATKKKTLSPKVVRLPKKKRLSPILSPVKKQIKGNVARIISAESCKPDSPAGHSIRTTGPALIVDSHTRAPLSAFRLNVPGSPAVSQKLAKSRLPSKKGTPSKLGKPFSPFVDVDIIVLDDDGKIFHKERRVSRTSIGASSARHPQSKDVQAGESGESELDTIQPRRPKRHIARKQIIIVSDDSDSDEETSPKLAKSSGSRTSNLPLRMSKATHRSVMDVVVPPAPYRINQQNNFKQRSPSQHSPITPHSPVEVSPEKIYRQKVSSTIQPSSPPKGPKQPFLSQQNIPHFVPRPAPAYPLPLVPSPILKNRQLTPIRGRRNQRLFDPPSPPSPTTPTDFDLSIDFSNFSLESPSQTQDTYRSEFEVPEYLKPLLEECHQETCGPHNFSAFIESFPFDPITSRGIEDVDVTFRKIGEASYSEVFGIGDVVLKVIPIRDESEAGQSFTPGEEEGPAPSDAKDVRKEIIVTRAMGEVYNGFVKLLKNYVVRGRYPEVLLQLWDEYNERKGSESVRPGKDNFL